MVDQFAFQIDWSIVASVIGLLALSVAYFLYSRRDHEGGSNMPAYLIAEHIVTDPVKFEEYRTKVGPMMAKHGARYLTKGGTHKLPEGGHWKPERVVIIEFPDMDALYAWYNSPEYQPLIALRKSCTSDKDMLFVLEGA